MPHSKNSAGYLHDILKDCDIHTVTGALKAFLRDMSDPLLTNQLYHRFIQAEGKLSGIQCGIKQYIYSLIF